MPRHEVVLIPKFGEMESPVEISKTAPATEPTQQQKSGVSGKEVMIGALVVQTGKKIAIGTIARVGTATGNYTMNDQIRNVSNLAVYGGAIAVNPIVGGIYVLTDVGGKVFDYTLSMDKANKETMMYREATGLSTSQGSRLGGRKI